MNPLESKESPQGEPHFREVRLRVFLETFDVYMRAIAGIAAEGDLSEELAVEALMNYCLALPEADDLIMGFLRGDLAVFSGADQTREMIERDTRSLELEPAEAPVRRAPTDRLGKRLELMRRTEESGRVAAGGTKLEKFIRENPTTFKQVAASSHEFLVRWIMLHLMNEIEARERGHRVANEFWRQFPAICERLRMSGAIRAGQKPQAPTVKEIAGRRISPGRVGPIRI